MSQLDHGMYDRRIVMFRRQALSLVVKGQFVFVIAVIVFVVGVEIAFEKCFGRDEGLILFIGITILS